MLECGTDFKGTMPEKCCFCDVADNEHHRLNECTYWQKLNHNNVLNQCNFSNIYSENDTTLTAIIENSEHVWELRYEDEKNWMNRF